MKGNAQSQNKRKKHENDMKYRKSVNTPRKPKIDVTKWLLLVFQSLTHDLISNSIEHSVIIIRKGFVLHSLAIGLR